MRKNARPQMRSQATKQIEMLWANYCLVNGLRFKLSFFAWIGGNWASNLAEGNTWLEDTLIDDEKDNSDLEQQVRNPLYHPATNEETEQEDEAEENPEK